MLIFCLPGSGLKTIGSDRHNQAVEEMDFNLIRKLPVFLDIQEVPGAILVRAGLCFISVIWQLSAVKRLPR